MNARDAISFVLGNIEVPLFVIALIVAAIKMQRGRSRRVMSFSFTLWGEVLFYCIGLGFAYSWYFHAFAPGIVAPMIGWKPSPFEWELAWFELGLALVAALSLWRGYEMRLAASLTFAVFSFGAAAQHIHKMLALHNYAPENAGVVLWFGDLALPIVVLLLAWFSRDAYERTARRIGL